MEKGRVVSKVTRITLGSLDSQTKASTLHHSCLTNYCPTTRGGSGVGVEMKEKTRVVMLGLVQASILPCRLVGKVEGVT